MRGNLVHSLDRPVLSRSIPRACGATVHCLGAIELSPGLSPRMRGNPDEASRMRDSDGSIPAHAGQPRVYRVAHRFAGVYPRACGATERAQDEQVSHKGLSPRMRGNREPRLQLSADYRSIPAHAGQPLTKSSPRYCARVYPRACGATR